MSWSEMLKHLELKDSELELCALELEVERLESAEIVRDRVEGFIAEGFRGWMCLTDQVIEVADAQPLPGGIVLAGEICYGDLSVGLTHEGESWRLRRSRVVRGEGAYRVRTHRYRAVMPGARPGQLRAVTYELVWPAEPELDVGQGWSARPGEPVAVRFRGFTASREAE